MASRLQVSLLEIKHALKNIIQKCRNKHMPEWLISKMVGMTSDEFRTFDLTEIPPAAITVRAPEHRMPSLAEKIAFMSNFRPINYPIPKIIDEPQ